MLGIDVPSSQSTTPAINDEEVQNGSSKASEEDMEVD
jgi:hypothetical protein